jgi:hypothetical protein
MFYVGSYINFLNQKPFAALNMYIKYSTIFFNSVDIPYPYVDCVWIMSKGKRNKNNIKAKPRAMHIFSLFPPVLIHAFSQSALHITTAISVNENTDSK